MDGTNPTLEIRGPEAVSIVEKSIPAPGPSEVLIETDRTLISTGTELTVFSGEFPRGSHWDEYSDYPTESGYMNLGRVVETGATVEAFEAGDRVVSFTKHAKFVCPDRDVVYHVPESVSDESALFFAAAEISMHAIRRGRVDWGETAAVFGLGILGQVTARLLHFAGARPVLALNRSSPRVEMLPDVQGLVGISMQESDWHERVEERTNGDLADVVVEATGNAEAIADELSALRRQGRFVLLGCPQQPTQFDFHDQCNWPSYEIIGSHVTSHPEVETPQTPWTQGNHTRLFFDIVNEPVMADLGDLVSTSRPYHEAELAFEALSERRIDDVSVALDW